MSKRMTLISSYAHFIHQHIKDTPGKLMNILLKASPDTSPEIPAFKKQIKTFKVKDVSQRVLSLEHTPMTFLSFPQACICFPSPKL